VFGNLKTGQWFLGWFHVGMHYWSAGAGVILGFAVIGVCELSLSLRLPPDYFVVV